MDRSFRSADQQVYEYMLRQAQAKRRDQADSAFREALSQMQARFGGELTLGAMVRYVGFLLMSSQSRPIIRQVARFLAKCIAIGLYRAMLTKHRAVH